ncbi:MAG TPA: hypothetical protein VFI91_04920, partial [Longimicrobiaceae bacterium]|nr:hypothetical protein [Longimicrobiaceae bacterium]
ASGVEPGSHEHDAGLTTAAERLRVLGADGESVGGGGRVSSESVDAPAWSDPVWVCELVLPGSLVARGQCYEPIPDHPAIDRDLALIVAHDVSAQQVGDVIRTTAGDLLDSVWPFDMYEGKGIPEGTRSLAWRLRFRHPARTLTDAEIDDVISGVLASLESELDVHRR